MNYRRWLTKAGVLSVLLLTSLLVNGCGEPTVVENAENRPAPRVAPAYVQLGTIGLDPYFMVVATVETEVFPDYVLLDTAGSEPVRVSLVSPFFETIPIDVGVESEPNAMGQSPALSAQAQKAVDKLIPVKEAPEGFRIGAFPYGGREFDEYAWISDSGIAIYQDGYLVGFADLGRKQTVPVKTLVHSAAVSPDLRKVAQIKDGYLFVTNLRTQTEAKWSLSGSWEGVTEWFMESLTWSPNSRYLVASMSVLREGSQIGQLWVLDYKSGQLTNLNSEMFAGYGEPIWSSDSTQAVIYASLGDFGRDDGRWVLLETESVSSTLLASAMDPVVAGRIRIPDVPMEIETIKPDRKYLYAKRVERGLLYVSTQEVGLILNKGGTEVLAHAFPDGVYLPGVKFSPSGSSLAVPIQRTDEAGINQVTIDVIYY